MGLIQVTKENEKYYTKEFVRGFNLGAETQYEIDANETKHGRWEIHAFYVGGDTAISVPYCSVCNRPTPIPTMTDFCPNCGAKMDEVNNG